MYAIDPRFGTADMLSALSTEVKKRGMCLILDIVINHVRPIPSEADLAAIHPFNKSTHYHTYKKLANQTFVEYARKPVDCLIDPCRPGDYTCRPGNQTDYDQARVEQGWFTDYRFNISMGDLAQERPEVGDELKRWVGHMVKTYALDALRLDTTPYMNTEFLAQFRADA